MFVPDNLAQRCIHDQRKDQGTSLALNLALLTRFKVLFTYLLDESQFFEGLRVGSSAFW